MVSTMHTLLGLLVILLAHAVCMVPPAVRPFSICSRRLYVPNTKHGMYVDCSRGVLYPLPRRLVGLLFPDFDDCRCWEWHRCLAQLSTSSLVILVKLEILVQMTSGRLSPDEDMRRRSPLRRESFSFLGVRLPGNVAGVRCEEVPRGDLNYSHSAFSCAAVIEPREVRC